MARNRKIKRDPSPEKNYYVVDANFLANCFIPPERAPKGRERTRIVKCDRWWDEISRQLDQDHARVYLPDIAIAETFKVLAKKYYKDKWFRSSQDFHYWRTQLRKTVSTPKDELRKANRKIRVHDVESNRDIIIAVDRFYELFFKHGKKVSLPDLLIVATAKYLLDFYDLPRAYLHIITMDRALRDGSKKISELPNAYDPAARGDEWDKVFE